MSGVRAALAAILRGEDGGWAALAHESDDAVWRRALAEGVLPIVADAAVSSTACPATLRERLAAARRQALAADLVREHELRRVVAALSAAGLRTLIMKGADLAYSVYPSPDLRQRTDTDLLVAPDDREAASQVLHTLGYEAVGQSGGPLLMYQQPFRLIRDEAVAHVIDLHWRAFNPHRFGNALTFAELDSQAEPRPRLGHGARGLGGPHALALACVHRVAHHYNDDRLIWLYDVRLIAGRMTGADWDTLTALARARGIEAACARPLEAARAWVAAPVPADRLAALCAAGEDVDDAAFYDPRAAHVRRVLSDVRHVKGWGSRVQFARDHLFPPATYMRTVYAPASVAPLWVLYLRRIARGARRWLVRT